MTASFFQAACGRRHWLPQENLLARFLLAFAMAAAWWIAAPPQAQAQTTDSNPCGALSNAYGPFDYRSDKSKLGIVERFHFEPRVEALISGTSGYIGGDINYTLHAFPNHHRALVAMMRYARKMQTPQPRGFHYPAECYFDRAIRFRSDDIVVRLIYATFLQENKRNDAASEQLRFADGLAQDNAIAQQNIGLVYFDMGDYANALAHAHKAEALGYAPKALQERLQAAGKWVAARETPTPVPSSGEPPPPLNAPAPPPKETPP